MADDRHMSEASLAECQRQVRERTKELRLVYAISRIVDAQQDMNTTLQAIVDRLPASWQFPRRTCARIVLQHRTFVTRNFDRTPCGMRRRILVSRKPVGTVEVYRLDLANREGAFLAAEEALLDVVAERIGKVIDRSRVDEQLRAANERLRQLFQREQTVREAERKRIAHEIHDELGQALSALAMDVGWLRRHAAQVTGVPERLDSMSHLVDEALRTVRRIAGELRPLLLDSLGLVAAVQWFVDEFRQRTGIACSLSLRPDTMAPPRTTAILLFRVLQELLTNILRHAQARRVTVALSETPGMIRLAVSDDGKGFPPTRDNVTPSLGLLGIRESVEALGGRFVIQSRPQKGTRVSVTVPRPP